MKQLFAYAASVLAGAVLMQAAIFLSQEDCAITVKSGAIGGTISGFYISGHKKGICVRGGPLTIANNVFDLEPRAAIVIPPAGAFKSLPPTDVGVWL